MAVEEGIDPVLAISMATLSTADVFGFDHGTLCAQVRRGAIAPGKRADILLLDDLAFTAPPHRVYSAGELVAEDGAFVGRVAPVASRCGLLELEGRLRDTVHLPKLSLDVFSYEFRPGEAVIDVLPGNAVTGTAHPETDEGLRRIMLIERHGRGVAAQGAGVDGGGPAGAGLAGKHIGQGWVRGFTITAGPSRAPPDTIRIMSAWWETTRRTCSRLSRPWGKVASFSCGTARSSPRSTCRSAAS